MEEEIYSSGGLKVTNHRLLVNSDTYILDKVASASIREKPKPIEIPFIVSFVFLVGSIIGIGGGILLLAVFSVAGLSVCIYAISRLRIPRFSIVIEMGELKEEVFTSTNKLVVVQAVDAINQVIDTNIK